MTNNGSSVKSTLIFSLLLLFQTKFALSNGSHGHGTTRVTTAPEDSSYTTLVTIGGLGLRGIIPAVILVELEQLINEHIRSDDTSHSPTVSGAHSIHRSRVQLADYIDSFSGTSSGSWIALYLASKGGNGHSAGIFNQREIIEKYGLITPGSAKGLLVFFHEYGEVIFPQEQATANVLMVGTNPITPGVVTPLLSNNGLKEALEDLLGDTQLSDLSTSCLVTSYDLVNRAGTMFIYDDLVSPPQVGFTQSIRSNEPDTEDLQLGSRIEPSYGRDFLLRDIATGSASEPVVFPAYEAQSINAETNDTMLLVEGTLYFAQEIFPAAIQIANSTGDTTFSSLAVLSLGPGLTVPNLEDNVNGGAAQWVASGELATVTTVISAEYFSKQTEYFFAANPNVKPGQYLRIQPFGEVGTPRGGLLSRTRIVNDLPSLEAIGEEFAALYRPALQSFVKQFIFG
eukprot:g4862.t1